MPLLNLNTEAYGTLAFDRIEMVERFDEPPARPVPEHWWSGFTRAHRKAMQDFYDKWEAWNEGYIEWIKAGSPPREVRVRTVIPNAHITSIEQNFSCDRGIGETKFEIQAMPSITGETMRVFYGGTTVLATSRLSGYYGRRSGRGRVQ